MPSNDKPALREQSGRELGAAHSSAFVHSYSSTKLHGGQIAYHDQGPPVSLIPPVLAHLGRACVGVGKQVQA